MVIYSKIRKGRFVLEIELKSGCSVFGLSGSSRLDCPSGPASPAGGEREIVVVVVPRDYVASR